ncbi:hypothetical protein Hanom_Chr04g00284711 [Helianthus anomalus]
MHCTKVTSCYFVQHSTYGSVSTSQINGIYSNLLFVQIHSCLKSKRKKGLNLKVLIANKVDITAIMVDFFAILVCLDDFSFFRT